MNAFAPEIGLVISAVVAACCLTLVGSSPAIASRFSWGAHWTPTKLSFFVLATLALLLFPFGEAPAIYHLRGLLGEFSVTTLVLACAALAGRFHGRPVVDPRQSLILLAGIGAVGLVLYPTALGLTRFDLYAWGYFATPMLAGIGLLGFIALALRLHWIVFILGAALLTAGLDLLPSGNLWDHLTDLPLTLFALAALGVLTVRRLIGRARE
ncbi:hypothetical protein [Desulfonatronum sp. SC1]|uniref:hypothetical protein n=1 Tax=Desulfonatronum sp. SC1 TaxID=2109626 RepID=UPI000D2F6BD2|nr:hypothetical protein [Desulfonatronum sp. SC1]PTN31617.1 hypothetical protein C6366_17890 [Desulfonatronum sp. SC1]